ncbi:SANT/Myb_domain [Hexamita inflata]|uniref:SANT/Myb domain n=1 Tax=Hexamita inflata TaxID=28002 RepID=A0AA86NXF8_9EUKA|nr:SANT/Myb domain [Hexamita inflata]
MSANPNPKQQLSWQEQEIQQFLACYQVYGDDFHSYTQHLNRSYSQIKSFFHNWLKKQPTDIQCKFKVRGGYHKVYRNNVTVNDLDQKVIQLKFIGRKPQK